VAPTLLKPEINVTGEEWEFKLWGAEP